MQIHYREIVTPDVISSEGEHWVLYDGWRTPYFYRSDGAHYVLISFGNDHRPDRSDYWPPPSDLGSGDVAGCWPCDQTASELGWYQAAGK